MSSSPDIKPDITGATLQSSYHQAALDRDEKPTFTSTDDTRQSWDFQQKRESLKRHHDLERKYLDLQEEHARIKEELRLEIGGRPSVKLEPVGDVKPYVSHMRHGDNLATLASSKKGGDEDDDIVFLREVKAVDSKLVIPGQGRDETSPEPSTMATTSENTDTFDTGPEPPIIPMEIDEKLLAARLPPLTADRRFTGRVAHTSTSSESDFEDSDDTYTGRSPRPIRTLAAKRKKADRRHRRGSTASDRRSISIEAGASQRSGGPVSARAQRSDHASDTDQMDEENTDDQSSEGADYTGPYLGPHLDVLSVDAINSRLDRSCRKYKMTVQYLREWAAWWPRTKVARYHHLDSPGIWLLAVGVHKWWSDLSAELQSPKCKWPKDMGESEKEDILLKLEEIMCAKRNIMIQAKRKMLEDGEAISEEAAIDLRSSPAKVKRSRGRGRKRSK